MTSSEKLQRWFVESLRVLKEIPNGDGAFVALSIGCQLCERFYRAKTGTQEVQDGIPFQEEAGRALGVGEDRFKRFWKAFRHGMQHQGSPKTYQQGGIDYKWRISSSYNVVPDEVVIDRDDHRDYLRSLHDFVSNVRSVAQATGSAASKQG